MRWGTSYESIVKTDWKKYFFDYKTVDLCKNIDEYNLQLAELDANAFGGLVMIKWFNLKPLFIGLSDCVKNNIYKYMDKLESEMII